eukprot:2832529-Pyramimonas_sp.AAC.1
MTSRHQRSHGFRCSSALASGPHSSGHMLECFSELLVFNDAASNLEPGVREHVLQAICERVHITVDTAWWLLWK